MDEKRLAGVRVTVHGYVQGVFFRDSTKKQANELGLTGWVSNLPDGNSVEVNAEGERPKLEMLIAYLRTGPPQAQVEEVVAEWSDYSGQYSTFLII